MQQTERHDEHGAIHVDGARVVTRKAPGVRVSRCDAELCSFWTGHGCICDTLDLEPDEHDCMTCGRHIPRGELAMAEVGPVHIACPHDDNDEADECPGPIAGHGCDSCRSDHELHPEWYVL